MSTIFIEGQEIPIDFVKTTVTGFAGQRLQTINQRIMSSTKLLEIINRYRTSAKTYPTRSWQKDHGQWTGKT